MTSSHHSALRRVAALTVLTLAMLVATAAAASTAAAQTGIINGSVTYYGESTTLPLAGAQVTASNASGASYSATTDANGNYQIDNVAPDDYSVTFTAPGYDGQTLTGIEVADGSTNSVSVTLQPQPGTISGSVTDSDGAPSYGVQVEAVPTGLGCPTGYICGPEAVSDSGGHYLLSGLDPGSYDLFALDSGQTLSEGSVNVGPGSSNTVAIALPPAPVPAGTTAKNAQRDLNYLNALRTSLGLPAGIALSPRWSTDCAAHDAYERINHVLTHPEMPSRKGASIGGAWAGEHSILAEYVWTSGLNPWWTAPVHLIQLLSPSLSVIGIDNNAGFQCATTWPGLLRTPGSTDTVTTYPSDGARNVPPSEDAQESPFVPGQFVGIRAGRTAGRELFVYLNLANQTGQAQVTIVKASLRHGRHAAAVRWVDNTTKTIGPYLSGAIVIPVRPMRPKTVYTASVTIKDGSSTLTHSWSFTTARR